MNGVKERLSVEGEIREYSDLSVCMSKFANKIDNWAHKVREVVDQARDCEFTHTCNEGGMKEVKAVEMMR